MNNYSKFLDKKIFNIVGKCADKLNYETYVVGGWVRDLLMGRIKMLILTLFVLEAASN